MFDTRAFGELIRHLRTRRKLSQIELAERIGAEYRVVANLERGGRLYVRYLFDLCKELGISVSFHITGDHVPAHLAAALARGFDFTEPEDRQMAIILAELASTHMAENDMDAGAALEKIEVKDRHTAFRLRRKSAKAEQERLGQRYSNLPEEGGSYEHEGF